MTGDSVNDDLKAKMREALEKKKAGAQSGSRSGSAEQKAHGSEVNGSRRMYRRKAG